LTPGLNFTMDLNGALIAMEELQRAPEWAEDEHLINFKETIEDLFGKLGLGNQMKKIQLLSTPVSRVNILDDVHHKTAIQADAVFFSFLFRSLPATCTLEHQMKQLELLDSQLVFDPLLAFLINGGFVYYGKDYNIVAIHALYFGRELDSTTTLVLGEHIEMDSRIVLDLDQWGLWFPLMNNLIDTGGFSSFTWICPNNSVADTVAQSENVNLKGGFAYKRRTGPSAIFFPVIQATLHVPGSVLLQLRSRACFFELNNWFDIYDNSPRNGFLDNKEAEDALSHFLNNFLCQSKEGLNRFFEWFMSTCDDKVIKVYPLLKVENVIFSDEGVLFMGLAAMLFASCEDETEPCHSSNQKGKYSNFDFLFRLQSVIPEELQPLKDGDFKLAFTNVGQQCLTGNRCNNFTLSEVQDEYRQLVDYVLDAGKRGQRSGVEKILGMNGEHLLMKLKADYLNQRNLDLKALMTNSGALDDMTRLLPKGHCSSLFCLAASEDTSCKPLKNVSKMMWFSVINKTPEARVLAHSLGFSWLEIHSAVEKFARQILDDFLHSLSSISASGCAEPQGKVGKLNVKRVSQALEHTLEIADHDIAETTSCKNSDKDYGKLKFYDLFLALKHVAPSTADEEFVTATRALLKPKSTRNKPIHEEVENQIKSIVYRYFRAKQQSKKLYIQCSNETCGRSTNKMGFMNCDNGMSMSELRQLQEGIPMHLTATFVAERCIKQGIFSSTYKVYAYDPSEQRIKWDFSAVYFLKVVRPYFNELSFRDVTLKRLEREAGYMMKISSPYVITLFHAEMAPDVKAYTMMFKHSGGDSLDTLLRNGAKFTTDEIMVVAADVLAGLECIHELGAIHRDIGSKSIMRLISKEAGSERTRHIIFDAEYIIQVRHHNSKEDLAFQYLVQAITGKIPIPGHEFSKSDLNKDQKIDPQEWQQAVFEGKSSGHFAEADLNSDGKIDEREWGVSTERLRMPENMAPELWPEYNQTLKAKDVDFRVDIWAVGVLMFYLTVGKLPFETKCMTVDKKISLDGIKDLKSDICNLRGHAPDINETLQEIADQYYQDGNVLMHTSTIKRLSSLPQGLCMAVGRAMQKKKEARFASAKEMREAIRESSNEYTIFISYRQKTEYQFALMLYDELHNRKTVGGNTVSVFLDQKCLKDAEDWEQGFCDGLFKSRIYMPIITAGFTGSYLL
jgi:serine/threonine protein kinase